MFIVSAIIIYLQSNIVNTFYCFCDFLLFL
nr:MAG TPA: hypothetical protein [Caudoviricetes sp.]